MMFVDGSLKLLTYVLGGITLWCASKIGSLAIRKTSLELSLICKQFLGPEAANTFSSVSYIGIGDTSAVVGIATVGFAIVGTGTSAVEIDTSVPVGTFTVDSPSF